ncbi:hypothetical protein E4U34_000048 [Claviceps purpurea]|nr:hypothetical protein E4U34_000048 [Claviceps purpurea]
MKFSTVLGTFALSTLEAYHAYASPLEPGAQSLEGRGTEYCCIETIIGGSSHSGFVSYPLPQLTGVIASAGICQIVVTQTSIPPSQGGCAKWKFESKSCFDAQNPAVLIHTAEACQ